MRNLKKVLTLVLTLAMLLSVMVVGAGAAFSDQDSIKNTEAVNTCNALNIINGENGSFYPTRNVTRAEMCKMICVALNGGREPALATGIGSTFTDTVGHWASPYIEYCVREGVVGGIGGGLFDPNGAVTGTQAAKMLLVAMGYDAGRQGYVGSNSWELNINSDAAKKGLYDGLESIDASAPLNRDNAAQIIYNAVDAPMVEYVFSAQTVNGSLTMVPTLKDRTKLVSDGTTTVERFCTILLDKYEVYSNYGQLVDVDGSKLSIVHDENYDSQSTGSQTSFSKITTDYTDLLGQTVKVLYKKTSDQVLGVAPVDGNKTYTVAVSDIETADNGNKVKFGGTEYKLEELVTNPTTETKNKIAQIVVNGSGVSAATSVAASALAYNAGSPSYNTVTFVDNDNDGTLEYAIVTDVITGKVTYANSDEIMVKGVSDSYKRDDNQIASGVAKDEYVTVIYNPFTEQNMIDVIAKGTGKLSVNSDGECMFSGDSNWYKVGTTGLTSTNAGTSYDYWAYNGVLVDKDNAKNDASIDNLVMLLKLTDGTLSDQARLLYADGTKKDVNLLADVDDDNDDYVDLGALTEGSLYLAIETKDGWGLEEISVTNNSNKEIGDYTFHDGAVGDVANGSSGNIETVGTIPIPDSAIVFVYGGDYTGSATAAANTGKILTGKELKNQAASGTSTDVNEIATQSKGFFTSTVNGLNRASIIAVTLWDDSTELPSGGVIGDNYGLIVGNCTDNGSTISYTVWTGAENKDVTEDKNDLTGRSQYTVIAYDTIDANGNIEGVDVVTTDGTVGLWSVESDKIWIDNSHDYKLTSDTVYMCYDSKTSTVREIGKVGGKDNLKAADYAVGSEGVRIPNVKYHLDGSDVDFILIDVNNRINDETASVTTAISGMTSYTSGATATLNAATAKYGDVLELDIVLPANMGAPATAGKITLTNAVNAADGSNIINLSALQNTDASNVMHLDKIYVVVTGGSTVSGAFTTG